MEAYAANLDQEKLEFAYKYPFSKEAKELVKQLSGMPYDDKFAVTGLLRVNEDLQKEEVEFVFTNYHELMLTYLLSYVYARMLVSATGNAYIVKKFAIAEASRASSALSVDTSENIARLASELNVGIKAGDGKESIGIFEFLKIAKAPSGLHLVEMDVKKGNVYLSREQTILLLRDAIVQEVMKGLPIPKNLLPGKILEHAKEIKLPEQKIETGASVGRYAWIEKLLSTPIPDIRHRSVNLILAPYLTNVKGLDEETAANIIIDYIEKCKQLNPNTRVNDAYIRYQCKYAKAHKLKPLSLAKARELFKGVLEL